MNKEATKPGDLFKEPCKTIEMKEGKLSQYLSTSPRLILEFCGFTERNSCYD